MRHIRLFFLRTSTSTSAATHSASSATRNPKAYTMKELDIIFSSLSRRLGIADDSAEAMALDVAKLEVLGL